MNLLWGILGIVVILGLALLLSSKKKAINIRTICGGLAIQILFAFIVLKWEAGQSALQWFTLRVQDIINYANEGISFLFGSLANSEEFGSIFCVSCATNYYFLFIVNICSLLFRYNAVDHQNTRWRFI